MISLCAQCESVREHLTGKIGTSKFGKLAQQCSSCHRLWIVDKEHRAPYEVQVDKRLAPPANRQAFVNDPRRGGPK